MSWFFPPTMQTEDRSRRLVQVLRPAAASLFAWAVLLRVAAFFPALGQWLLGWLATAELHESLAAAAALAAVLLILTTIVRGHQLLKGWSRRPNWTEPDTALFLFGFFALILLLHQRLLHVPLPGLRGLPWTVAGFLLLISLRALILLHFQLKRVSREETSLDATRDDRGLAPLQSESEDELDRGKLLDELYALMTVPRMTSVNFGLEGSWGSGKTSLLNFLRVRLHDEGFPVITLDLWSYREPRRLVLVYFQQLAKALAIQAPHLQTRRLLRRLAGGLVELGGGRLAKASEVLFGDLATEPLEITRHNLANVLRTLERPLIVFLDDLDRIDRDELLAVLRSVRLVSELPNLTQVLAYDRDQLAHTLFPDDPTGTRARDHIGKIVNREFTIGSPPRELATAMLEESLKPFLETLDSTAIEEFQKRTQVRRIALFASALPTPREVRRVAKATSDRWNQMKGHLNPFDLFVLTIVQYRFPSVYRMIRANPEWFVELKWSQDPFFMILDSEREQQRAKGRSFVDELASRGHESALAVQLLEILFPNLLSRGNLDELEARKARRIAHPWMTDRYFHLYVSKATVSEKEIETYGEQLLAEPAGERRQRLLARIIADEATRKRLDSFLDQWSLVFGQHQNTVRHGQNLVRDLALGLAQSAQVFSDDWRFLGPSQLQLAAYKVLFLSLHLPDREAMTRLLVEVVRSTDRLSFAGTIVLYSPQARRPAEHREAPEADKDALETALADKVVGAFQDSPKELLELRHNDRAAALFGTGDDNRIADLVYQALRDEPELLPRILELGAPIRTDEDGTVVAVEDFNPQRLATRLDMRRLHALTRSKSVDSWEEEREQVLVRRFRAWIGEAGLPVLGSSKES